MFFFRKWNGNLLIMHARKNYCKYTSHKHIMQTNLNNINQPWIAIFSWSTPHFSWWNQGKSPFYPCLLTHPQILQGPRAFRPFVENGPCPAPWSSPRTPRRAARCASQAAAPAAAATGGACASTRARSKAPGAENHGFCWRSYRDFMAIYGDVYHFLFQTFMDFMGL